MKEKQLYVLLAVFIAAGCGVFFTHKHFERAAAQTAWKSMTSRSHTSIIVFAGRKKALILNVPQGNPSPKLCIGINTLVFGARYSLPVRSLAKSKQVYILHYFEKENQNNVDDAPLEKTYVIVLRDEPPQVPEGAFMWDIHSAAQQ